MIALPLLIASVQVKLFTLRDEGQKKDLPIRVSWKEGSGKTPVIIFSHGLGGARTAMNPLSEYWAEHGYIVIQPSHADSHEFLSIPEKARMYQNSQATIRKAWSSRPKDDVFLLDSFDRIEKEIPSLKGRLDASRVAIAGHSFGAHTTQILAGTKMANVSWAESRPLAFLCISPQGVGGAISDSSFATVTKPLMVISGSEDFSPLESRSGQDVKRRTDLYRLSPAGDKYLLWIEGASHNFGGISGTFAFPGAGKSNPDHVSYVQKGSTAFFDAYLKSDASARMALKSGSAVSGKGVSLTSK